VPRKTPEGQCDVIWARKSITKEDDDEDDNNKRRKGRGKKKQMKSRKIWGTLLR
jgi:hypothetical protein